jgi:predicted phosphodiesterase
VDTILKRISANFFGDLLRMRIFAISDLHVDYPENFEWVEALSRIDYIDDVLLVAGDISHEESLVCRALETLNLRFRDIFFVPGNHDLWLRDNTHENSLVKFNALLARCKEMGIHTGPKHLENGGPWIVPLYSWYLGPHEGLGSLYVAKRGEDAKLSMWADKRAVCWPHFEDYLNPANFFLSLNDVRTRDEDHSPVISFSHFLPRSELMFWTEEEFAATGLKPVDPQPWFNFSRVAGCSKLDEQIRTLGSSLHVYGHQHRNRDRTLEGVRYVSHCLGYPRERDQGRVRDVGQAPLLIWEG